MVQQLVLVISKPLNWVLFLLEIQIDLQWTEAKLPWMEIILLGLSSFSYITKAFYWEMLNHKCKTTYEQKSGPAFKPELRFGLSSPWTPRKLYHF